MIKGDILNSVAPEGSINYLPKFTEIPRSIAPLDKISKAVAVLK